MVPIDKSLQGGGWWAMLARLLGLNKCFRTASGIRIYRFGRRMAMGVGIYLLIQCVGSQKSSDPSDPNSSDSLNSEADKAPPSSGAPQGGAQEKVASACVSIPGIKDELPYYLPAKNLVITRFVSPCVPNQGGIGISPKSQWLAMGFPCTGGGGRIDIRGKYLHPNSVSFVIGTECSMIPATKEQVHSAAVEKVGFPADAPLAAFLPFVVQYWEVTGQQEADIGFAIDLKSSPSLEGLWKNFRENQGFSVRLYGRENSWVPGGHFYQVEASLHIDGRSTFKMNVQGVKKLSPEETAKVRQRCEMLRPARNCAAVF